MRIPVKYFFGAIFLFFSISIFIQAAYLKWKGKIGWISIFVLKQFKYMTGSETNRFDNMMGNIALAISMSFLVQAVLVYLYPFRLNDILGLGSVSFTVIVITTIVIVLRTIYSK